ncbi:MAG TPA: hypothetical protein VEY30_13960, partial [Myxococcaceae bacterium]|nr:hypothetical protein [Myxococcaceae bacterium]
IYQRTGDPDLEAQTRRDLGRALRRLGDEEGARSELTAARDLFDALGLVDQTERTRNLLLH